MSVWSDPVLATSSDVAALGGGRSLLGASIFDPSAAVLRGRVRPLRPLSVCNFGQSTPGCRGAHRIDVLSAPRTGNLNFGFVVDRGPFSSLGLLTIGLNQIPLGADPFALGIALYIDLLPPAPALFLEMPTDGTGLATALLPLPKDPALINLQAFAQAAFFWPGTCSQNPTGFSASDALALTIQSP